MGLVIIIAFVALITWYAREDLKIERDKGSTTRKHRRRNKRTHRLPNPPRHRHVTRYGIAAKEMHVDQVFVLCALDKSPSGLEAYIYKPPTWALQDTVHGGCFTALGKGWYSLHQESHVTDPDLAFDGLESVLLEMYWRSKRRSA